MSWDVTTAEDCPVCGQTMFKKSGRGRMKPFCINESCSNFLPEDKRGYYKKKDSAEQQDAAGEKQTVEETSKAKKSTAKKTATKKPATKKTTTKKTAAKKTTTRKSTKKTEEEQA